MWVREQNKRKNKEKCVNRAIVPDTRSLVGKSPVFNLSGNVDLKLPFLQGMLLDIQISLTPGQGITPTAATDSVCEPTKDNWENM